MSMLKLEGWCLPTSDATTLPGPKSHFFLNSHYVVSARPVVMDTLAGYLVVDETEAAYFLAVSEAEMSMLFQMAS
jgi:hypothetical protein